VDWYLGHDRAPLPHLFRALLPFWLLADDILGQARTWSASSCPIPAPSTRRPAPRCSGRPATTANQAGDGTAALAVSQQLEPLLTDIDDPFLHAVCHLAVV
jgi:hypothetical protein